MMSWQKTHRIESFAMSVAAVCFGLLAVCGSIWIKTYSVTKDLLNEEAIYAERFTTSLSGVEGKIEQVYTNADHTKCAVLVRFDDMAKMSVNAEDYQFFVRGFNVQTGGASVAKISAPAGGYCIFGGSGRALIYLSCAKGFGSNALECIVRSNRTIYSQGSDSSEMQELKASDGSFAQYDQYRIIFNPNANQAVPVDFLDNLDTKALYKQAIVNNAEVEMRQSLAEDINKLKTSYDALTAYRENLDGLGVRVPSLPEEIAADRFTTETIGEEEVLVYSPGTIYNGGVDFDWFHQTLSDGSFLEKLVGTQTPSQYFSTLSASAAIDSETIRSLNTEDWTMKDGSEIRSDSLDENVSTIRSNINSYVSSVREYCKLKKEYQRTDLISYLMLEYNMENAGENMSGSFREGIVTAW